VNERMRIDDKESVHGGIVQSTEYKVQSTKYKVQSTKYKVQSTEHREESRGLGCC